MRLGNTLTFAGVGTQTFNAGDLVVNEGKKCKILGLKCTIPIHNGTGGNAALTFAQVLTFFSGFLLTLKYGTQGRQPFVGVDFKTLLEVARDQIGDYWPGANDTTQMTATVADGVTKSAVVYLQIPTGVRWKDESLKNNGGFGPYQASTMQAMVQWVSTTLPASWTIVGSITMQLVYFEVDSEGEAWDFLPEYQQYQSAQQQIDLDDGLHLLVFEKSATAAASALTNVTVTADGAAYPIHDQVAAADIAAEYTADPEQPTAAQISDTYTPLLAYNTQRREREYVPGRVHLRQNGAMQLTPWNVGDFKRPLVSEGEFAAEVQAASKALKRPVYAVYQADLTKSAAVPSWLKPFTQLIFATTNVAEGNGLESLRSVAGQPAQPHVPASAAAVHAARAGTTRGNSAAEAKHVADIASRIPGGTTNPSQGRKSDGLHVGGGIAVQLAQAVAGPK